VTAEGKVTDVEIVESSPPRIFDRVVLKEVARWEYLPRLVNGQAQATRVVERKYVFQL
ncbi:energy transducer TonB, partial [Oleiphilus sp. HI0067]